MKAHQKPYEELLQAIINILIAVRKHVSSDSDLTWVYYQSAADMRNEIDKYIAAFKNGSIEFLDEVNVHFAVTAAYQEHSMANGWSAEYLSMAEEFDSLYKALSHCTGTY